MQNTSSIAAAELGDDRWGFLKCCCGQQDCPCCMDEPMWETQFDTHQKNIEKLKQPQPTSPTSPTSQFSRPNTATSDALPPTQTPWKKETILALLLLLNFNFSFLF